MLKKIRSLLGARFFRIFIYIFLLLILLVEFSNYIIICTTKDKLFSNLDSVPFRNIGLVLGANKYAYSGKNLFFEYRIDAALQLFKAGKIKHIIVSGDNHSNSYDESTDMKNALIGKAVPDSCITLDYAGFRTFDSVIRCKEIFGQNSFTVISQEFHNERAVYIASYFDMNVIGFNAQDVPSGYSAKTTLREHFARFKCILDLYILKVKPKFLGKPEKINI